MDPDHWDCFERGKTHVLAEFHKNNLDIWGHSRKRIPKSYSCITDPNNTDTDQQLFFRYGIL